MLDVIVAGAGPAGSIAGLLLARAGVRVLLVDRAVFPREKLCGDTLNPGALALLSRLGLHGGPLERARPLNGMLLTGAHATVRAEYGPGIAARAITRYDLDVWLLESAIAAGVRFESALVARQPLLAVGGALPVVRGLVLAPRGRANDVSRLPASVVIAADGHRSALARALSLARVPARPRRWAYGVYATGVQGLSDVGEMHVARSTYIGIAPLTDTRANICVVVEQGTTSRDPLELVRRSLDACPRIAERCRDAVFVGRPRILGPLATDASEVGVEGLLLAGDAAGFVDPITGDGLHLAMQGGMLAAEEVLRTLETGDFSGAPRRLAEARRTALAAKLRFNRIIRHVTSSPMAIELTGVGAILAPGIMRRVVRYAGDVGKLQTAHFKVQT
jgi:flavin-dependent dehydrogenase